MSPRSFATCRPPMDPFVMTPVLPPRGRHVTRSTAGTTPIPVTAIVIAGLPADPEVILVDGDGVAQAFGAAHACSN